MNSIRTRALGVLAVAAAATLLIATPAAAAPITAAVDLAAGSYPQVSINPSNGNALIVYTNASNGYVYGTIVSKDLAPITAPFNISGVTTDGQPFAEWNPDTGNWLVGWADDSDVSVSGAIVSTTGVTTPPVSLATFADGNVAATFDDIEQVEVSYGGLANGYLVAFKGTSLGCQEIFGVLVDANGAPLSGSASVLSSALPGPDVPGACELEANDGVGIDFAPSAGTWLAAWKDFETGQASARVITKAGFVPTGASATATLGPISTGAPTVVFESAAAGYIVTWGLGSAIVANSVSTAGVGSAAGLAIVSDATSANPRRPRAAVDSTTGAVQFVAHNNSGSQILSWERAAGSATPVTPTSISDATNAGTRPSIASANGCSVVVWQTNAGRVFAAAAVQGACLPAAVVAPAAAPALPDTGAQEIVPMAIGTAALLAIGFALVATTRHRRTRA